MSRPSRRAVLRGAVTVVGASATLGAVGSSAGCARDRDEPDPLEPLLAAARSDAALAASAAAAVTGGGLAAALGPVVTARRAHADALATEIRRARPDRAATIDDPAVGAAAAGPSAAPADAAAARRSVVDALGAAEQAASGLAVTTTRYRCGLLGSVAAACAGLRGTLR